MIRARTRVEFLSAEEGGRTKPAFRGYSPNHNFGSPNDREMQMGRFELAEGQQVNPGETAEVTICFAGADNLQLLVCAGRQWRIQEGGQLVATGTVLEVAHAP